MVTILTEYYIVPHLLVIPIYPGHADTFKQSNHKKRYCCTIVVKYLKNIEAIASDHTEPNKKQHKDNNS